MEHLESIRKYFDGFSDHQWQQLEALEPLYREWNVRINVISRRDMDNFYVHHVLHSLSIMMVVRFQSGTRIMDVGTGGGFPGIPLAICFPECHFLLVDSIGKKVKVVQAVAAALGLKNVMATQARAETLNETFDFVVSRAVTTLPMFWRWTADKISGRGFNDLPNGLLYLKGGDLDAELAALPAHATVYNLSEWFTEDYLSTKKIVHICDRSQEKIFSKQKKT